MSFISVIVAKIPDIVLCEYTSFQGNFSQVSRLVLQKIQPNSIGIIKNINKKFIYVCEDKLIYMCFVEDISDEVAFCFLHDLKTITVESKYSYEVIMRKNAYDLNNLDNEIIELIDYYSSNPISSKEGQSIDEFKITPTVNESINKFLNKEVIVTVQSNQDVQHSLGKNLSSLATSEIQEEYNQKNKKKLMYLIGGIVAFMILTSLID